MSVFPFVLAVVIAILDKDGRVLITKRKKTQEMSGLWEFPGGKMQENEVPEDIIIRETKEELGIDISKNCLAPLTFVTGKTEKGKDLLLLCYICREWHDLAQAQEKQEIKWIFPHHMNRFKMPPLNRHIISFLLDII